MNYYIQGCAAKADKIKAAFERLGYDVKNWLFTTGVYYTLNGRIVNTKIGSNEYELILNSSDYKELELPVEPKFKVGDWLVYENGECFTGGLREGQVQTVEKDRYIFTHNTHGSFRFIDSNCRLWSIADAKDGDVITNGKMIVIFNKLEEPTYKQHIIAYVGLDLCGRLQITEDTWQLGVGKAIPATKEQRDLLFAKIKEAGYQWDADKKELRKIFEPKFKVGDEIFRPARNEYFKIKDIEKDNGTVWYVTTRTRIADNDKRIGEIVRINAFYQNGYSIAPKPHYDIANFHAGMPVLVRDYDNSRWSYVQFSHYVGECRMKFNACGLPYIQCIPFEGNEALLGTTEMPSEEYINW